LSQEQITDIPEKNNHPSRKRTRLKNWDYGTNGIYFLTICSEKRKSLWEKIELLDINDIFNPPKMLLNEYGKIVDKTIASINETYEHINIEKYVIMPNHIHLLVFVDIEDSFQKLSFINSAVPSVISTLKRLSNKVSGFNMFQRSYYDHIIRNQHDYETKWKYIDDNPAKWAEDEYFST